jgi:phage regulator Rha-like protein
MDIQLISSKIYEIQGQRVMLDVDLASLYGIETKVLNQAVKRNIERFPKDFAFNIDYQSFINLRSQIVTSNRGGRRHMPMAFTEHGVAMLASVLRSEKAIQMNIAIIRAFIAIRKTHFDIGNLAENLNRLSIKSHEHDIQLSEIYDALENLLDQKSEEKKWDDRDRIGFK